MRRLKLKSPVRFFGIIAVLVIVIFLCTLLLKGIAKDEVVSEIEKVEKGKVTVTSVDIKAHYNNMDVASGDTVLQGSKISFSAVYNYKVKNSTETKTWEVTKGLTISDDTTADISAGKVTIGDGFVIVGLGKEETITVTLKVTYLKNVKEFTFTIPGSEAEPES